MIGRRAVHQFHSGTAVGDAITNQMLDLRRLLRELGYESEIFAEHIAPGLHDRIHSVHGYRGPETDLILLHHSMGYEAFDDVIALPNDIVTVYHNVTPEQYFESESVRRHIRLGREQLMTLARRSRFGIAVSNFNRREMLAVGFRRVEVLPVRVDFSEFAEEAGSSDSRSNDWLYVGRIIGNKCQHDLVTAFAHYHRTFDKDARLLLIGDTRAEEYVSTVRAEAERLGVADHVVIIGKVSDPMLRSAFAGAGIFVSVSEHEGFGVPILEAMAAGVPVVAFGAAAVPETMSGAGVLLHTKEPAVVAAAVQAVQSDPQLRQRLVERQFARASSNSGVSTAGHSSVGSSSGHRGPSSPWRYRSRGRSRPATAWPWSTGGWRWASTGRPNGPSPSMPPKVRAITSRPRRTSSCIPRPRPCSPGPKKCRFPMWSSGRCTRRG